MKLLLITTWMALGQAGVQPEGRALEPEMSPITVDARIAPGIYQLRGQPGGAVRIAGDGLTVDFQGAELVGAPAGHSPDSFEGTGVWITGRDVTVRNLKVRGYKVGIHAVNCAGLILEDIDASGNFQQRLNSTPLAEEASDWLRPHENDGGEWRQRYGAGVYVESCPGTTVRRIRVRNGQNGIVLDRVNEAAVYDNDCSFLSGWGLALWRSSDNVITRNAFDFCVRGYSHGVYNRGQDSAGILMFEQCSRNLIAENSATHCGDGLFGFAGREALSTGGRTGNNDNRIFGNDFSDAAAHGIEMTFSFGNHILGNRLAGNAICGIWAGYSQDTRIAGNMIAGNGDAGYGAERGGINIEHGRGNVIILNTFQKNACGVRLWSDHDPHLAALPWVQAHDAGSRSTTIADNMFEGEPVAIELVDSQEIRILNNHMNAVGEVLVKDERSTTAPAGDVTEPPRYVSPEYRPLGDTTPVGARGHLHGREHIRMTEWGPYDYEGYRVLPSKVHAGREAAIQILGPKGEFQVMDLRGAVHIHPLSGPIPAVLTVSTTAEGMRPFLVVVRAGDQNFEVRGTLLTAPWRVQFFTWDESTDPLAHPEMWSQNTPRPAVHELKTDTLDFRWGNAPPAEGVPADHFVTVATTELPLSAGHYKLKTISDDGVRVWVNGALVIDHWTQHAPSAKEGSVVLKEEVHSIRVEHFELDGHAELRLQIIPQ